MQHRAAFKMRSFLHESVFILLFIDSDNVSLHLDIAQVKTHFTQEPLVTTVSSVNLTVACVRNTVPRSLRSFLHESVFTLLFLHCSVSLHFDIALVRTRFTREPLVTTVSSVNLTLACVPEKHRAASNLMSFRHESIFILLFTESHNGFLLFDIALVRAPFTRQSLVTNVSVKKKKKWQVSLRNTMPRSI